MDAGLAAVLGAAVGAIGSGGAAFATGWWAERQARRQVEGQQAIARDQVRFEHLKERREPRSAAYANYIAFVQNLRSDCHRALRVLLEDDDETPAEEFGASLSSRRDELSALFARVCVEGPEKIIQPAATLYRHARDFTIALGVDIVVSRQESPEATVTRADRLLDGIEEFLDIPTELFVDAARQVLDDYGAPPEPH
jgi:hypothetical protein